jgi:hypothetical protein
MTAQSRTQPMPVGVMAEAVITIPGRPAYALSPNSRCHWRVKQKATQEAHWAVMAAIRDEEAVGGRIGPFEGPVSLHWTVYLDKGGRLRE